MTACSVSANVSIGSSELGAGKMEAFVKTVTTREGLTAKSVSCPSGVALEKGMLSYCTARYADGETSRFLVRQTDGSGHVDVGPAEMTAPAIENTIVLALRRRGVTATASCPPHVAIVVGDVFTCALKSGTQSAVVPVKITSATGGYLLGRVELAK